MKWFEMTDKPNSMESKELRQRRIPHGEEIEVNSHRVYLPTADVDKLLEMQGGEEEYDNEGNLTFDRLGRMFNPEIIKKATHAIGTPLPLNDWEEANHWDNALSEFKSKGTDGDSEAVMLPSNIVSLFDNLTGKKNINPKTGHKQYASMSGFLGSLSSMLPSFSNSASKSMAPSGPLNLGASTNAGPNLSSMYGLSGQSPMQGFARGIPSALSSFGNSMYNTASNFYNSLPANPFGRTQQSMGGMQPPANSGGGMMGALGNMFSGMNPFGRSQQQPERMPLQGMQQQNYGSMAPYNGGKQGSMGGGQDAPSTYFQDMFAPMGRSAATNVANFVGPTLGGALGGAVGSYATPYAAAMAMPYIPSFIRSPIASVAGGAGGGMLGREIGRYAAPRIAGPIGEGIGRRVGQGMDYMSNAMVPYAQGASRAIERGGNMANSTLDRMYANTPQGMQNNAGNAWAQGMPGMQHQQPQQQGWGGSFGNMLGQGLNTLNSYSPASMLQGAIGNMLSQGMPDTQPFFPPLEDVD